MIFHTQHFSFQNSSDHEAQQDLQQFYFKKIILHNHKKNRRHCHIVKKKSTLRPLYSICVTFLVLPRRLHNSSTKIGTT